MKFFYALILVIANILNITYASDSKGYLPMGSMYIIDTNGEQIDIGNPTWLTGLFIQRDLNNNIISVHAIGGSDVSWFGGQFVNPTQWFGTFSNIYDEFKAWINWDLATVQSLHQNHTKIQLSSRAAKGEYWIGGIVSFILDATQIFVDAFVLPDNIRGKVVELTFNVFTQQSGLLSDVSLALREKRLNDAITITLKAIYTTVYEKIPEIASEVALVSALNALSKKYGAEIVNEGSKLMFSGLKSVEAFANGLSIVGKTGIYYVNYYDGEFNVQAAAFDLTNPNTFTNKTGVIHPLNDTGITLCFYGGIFVEDCLTGRDVTQNDNSDGYAGFSFTKILNGSCILDNVTGLIWANKTNDKGIHDADYLYSWNEIQLYISNVNSSSLCGYKDWRLPNLSELASIINYGVGGLDTNYFPYTRNEFYWSSSIAAEALTNYSQDRSSWGINFYSREQGIMPHSSFNRVQLVRN